MGSQPQAPPPPHPHTREHRAPCSSGVSLRSPGPEGPTERPETSPVLCGRPRPRGRRPRLRAALQPAGSLTFGGAVHGALGRLPSVLSHDPVILAVGGA